MLMVKKNWCLIEDQIINLILVKLNRKEIKLMIGMNTMTRNTTMRNMKMRLTNMILDIRQPCANIFKLMALVPTSIIVILLIPRLSLESYPIIMCLNILIWPSNFFYKDLLFMIKWKINSWKLLSFRWDSFTKNQKYLNIMEE